MISETGDAKRKEPVHQEMSFLPDCWHDDKRMGILFAEFRPKQLNVTGYDSKMKFWKDLIMSYCKSSGSSMVSVSMLKEQFRRKNCVPYCLNTVFDDMIAKGELRKRTDFEQDGTPLGWAISSFSNLMTGPLKWGYNTVRGKLLGPTKSNEEDDYVVVPIAQYHGKIIERAIVEREEVLNKVMNYDHFLSIIESSSNISKHGVRPALTLLAQNNRLISKTIEHCGSNTTLIKFAKPDAVAQPITSLEISVYELEQSAERLTKDISVMDEKINQTMNEIREYLKNGRKEMAKTFLKTKKKLEKNVQQKVSALENVNEMLLKIHEAESNKNILEVYKLGTNTMNSVLANAGITVDEVEKTISNMNEMFEDHNEILQIMSSGTSNESEDLELEQELSDLIDLKLNEANINQNDIHPRNVVSPTPKTVDNLSKIENFDKEIERRLAALRVDNSGVQNVLTQEL